MQTIFIVEDDAALRGELETLLARNGYDTQTSEDYGHLVSAIVRCAPDLVLLDLTLPVVDGQLICRELRQESSVALMVVTSRDNEYDELLAMSMGADDFITKPYNPQILLARIAALLRRSMDVASASRITHAGVVLDLSAGTISYGDGIAELTKNEMRLLRVLMEHAGEVVSRGDLMEALWQSDEFVDDNTLTVNINRLRTTLASLGVSDGFLQTRRGMGYLVSK